MVLETNVQNPSTCHTPETVATAAQLACLLEVSAEKPGNVTPTYAFSDTGYEDFLRSAVAIGPEMSKAKERGVGETILMTIKATRQLTPANTNLGITLLLAPLAKAALMNNAGLRTNLKTVLQQLTVNDAQLTYRAIRLVSPGGIQSQVQHDVRSEPTITLRQAMAHAVDRDNIAAEYLTDYAITFEQTLPAFKAAKNQGATTRQAVVQTYLKLLATIPDTLIVRKQGLDAARAVTRKAKQTLAAGGIFNAGGRRALTDLDSYLRHHPNNRLNPGTTADLIAAALFIVLLEESVT